MNTNTSTFTGPHHACKGTHIKPRRTDTLIKIHKHSSNIKASHTYQCVQHKPPKSLTCTQPKCVQMHTTSCNMRMPLKHAHLQLSQFFILSARGDVIIRRDYLGNVPKSSAETFFRNAKFWKEGWVQISDRPASCSVCMHVTPAHIQAPHFDTYSRSRCRLRLHKCSPCRAVQHHIPLALRPSLSLLEWMDAGTKHPLCST